MILLDTHSGMAKTTSLGTSVEARKDGASGVVRQLSISYLISASLGIRGSPDYTTDEGSSGGMKRVKWSFGILYAKAQSGRATPVK